uniref:TSA: Wollemia nobilis Ref_Wollemi_Transcript_18999_2255 transcribed RNA sequence n=1 Tax=Wollemia nobilis TaxID=56998 RepID=A0A0C9S5J4_9CONI
MLNVVSLSLLLVSLVTAGVFSPEPLSKSEEPKVLVREGHRVFMVEYEREGVLDAAKKGTRDAIHTAADYAKATGENIRYGASHVGDKAEVAGDKAIHVIKSGADKTKDAVKSMADKGSHAVKDKASAVLHHGGGEKESSADERLKQQERRGHMYETVNEKLSEAMDSVKDVAAGTEERARDRYHEAVSHLPNVGQSIVNKETAEEYGLYGDSKHEPAKENGPLKSTEDYVHKVGEILRDGTQKLSDVAGTEKVRDLKDDAGENYRGKVDSAKGRTKNLYGSAKDTASEKIKESGEALSRDSHAAMDKADEAYGSAKRKLSGSKDKIKEVTAETYDSASGKVADTGEKIKERAAQTYDSAKGKAPDAGEKVKESTEEAYNSTKGKISGTGEKIKETAGQTYGSVKDFVIDPVGRDGRDVRIQRALRHAGDAAMEKFRQALDEVYSMSNGGNSLPEVGMKAEKKTISLLSEDAKDAAANIEGAGSLTADFVKDAATNLSTGSSKGPRLMVARFKRLTSNESIKTGMGMLHMLAFSTIYGSSVWVNFLAGHVLASAIPRQQFGFIQSKIYPVYFKTMACGLSTCLLSHGGIHPWKWTGKISRWQEYNLFFSLLLTLVNLFFLEPLATKAMFEKLRIEKEEGRGTGVVETRDCGHRPNTQHEDALKCKMVTVNRKLIFLHRLSSAVNMLTLTSLTWHLVYLSCYIKS